MVYILSSDSLRAVILLVPISIGQVDLGETPTNPILHQSLQSNPMADEAQLYKRSYLYIAEL